MSADVANRAKSVDNVVFARVYNRVQRAGGDVDAVIDAVFQETGVKMKKNNVQVKASNLRRAGANLPKLKNSGGGRKRDIDALNALLEADVKAEESESGESESESEAKE